MPLHMVRVDLSEAPRLLRFPLPVMDFGIVTEENNSFRGRHHNQIEFCVRMSSDDEFAMDTVGETIYTNRFPHVFVKVDGPLHEYRYRGRREAFFFIYHSSLLPKFAEAGIEWNPPLLGDCSHAARHGLRPGTDRTAAGIAGTGGGRPRGRPLLAAAP